MTTSLRPNVAPKRRVNHRESALCLREQPGVWRLLGTYRARYSAQGIAREIRCGGLSYAPAGAFEARIEPVGDDTGVYARCISPDPVRALHDALPLGSEMRHLLDRQDASFRALAPTGEAA